MAKTMPGALEPPERLEADVWLEQQIWGHRFLNDQTPWLLLLESLGIMAYLSKEERILTGVETPGVHERISYSLMPRVKLRSLLFKDRAIDEIADGQAVSDASMWNDWFDRHGPEGEKEFGYLRDRFTRFTSFRNAVALLRSAEVESERSRRPTSRHLAPRGADMLMADYGEKRVGSRDKDRRFFARGGELLYLMLNRSSCCEELEPLIRTRLLGSGSRWNALARVLQPPVTDDPLSFEYIGYLPLPSHSVYDVLAEDWRSLLSLPNLPDDNLPEPLMRLSGLAVVQYITRRSTEVLGTDLPIFPLDMISSDTIGVQKISKDCYRRHRDQTRAAIVKVVDEFEATPEWATALKQADPRKAAAEITNRRFAFDVPTDVADATQIPKRIKQEALEDHEQHLGRVVGFYADRIGMAVAKRGSGRWYGASDGLIEAIVLANVREPMEFETFLELLWNRYRLIIGTEIGRQEFETVNYANLKANQRLLEERLRVLGLAKRLSDDCAFVINPFWE
ncbi:hypothetical protein BB934_45270 (plasmid) [Microvirga ossetica]|uniref:Uncharacterized protein n=1 Tax=Microvirga ossetica TaxID=1882682 RepID=A0A1B2EZZ5_9HYPH|nr:hypothetical protein BB934_45270 [Microvirga ossetica]